MGEVGDYVASLDGPDRDAVVRVLDRARALVPDADEGRSYGMPALRHLGRPLISVVVAKRHIGVYPFSPAAILTVADRLDGFDRSKGTIRFTPDHPLPDDVVDDLVRARRAEIDASAAAR